MSDIRQLRGEDQLTNGDVQVYPTDDYKVHQISRDCWCGPEQDPIYDYVWVHRLTH